MKLVTKITMVTFKNTRPVLREQIKKALSRMAILKGFGFIAVLSMILISATGKSFNPVNKILGFVSGKILPTIVGVRNPEQLAAKAIAEYFGNGSFVDIGGDDTGYTDVHKILGIPRGSNKDLATRLCYSQCYSNLVLTDGREFEGSDLYNKLIEELTVTKYEVTRVSESQAREIIANVQQALLARQPLKKVMEIYAKFGKVTRVAVTNTDLIGTAAWAKYYPAFNTILQTVDVVLTIEAEPYRRAYQGITGLGYHSLLDSVCPMDETKVACFHAILNETCRKDPTLKFCQGEG